MATSGKRTKKSARTASKARRPARSGEAKKRAASLIPEISVVIACYNRASSLRTLLEQLGAQSIGAWVYEILVVDDGSKEPVKAELKGLRLPCKLNVIRQENGGAAVARDHGIRKARGAIVVILDDDMRIEPSFIQHHLEAHEEGADVVLGHILPPKDNALPLFERFHVDQMEKLVAQFSRIDGGVEGVNLWTGNVSFKRDLYVSVGGFDHSLAQSEDRELGIRLEKAGARFGFAPMAISFHHSDHSDATKWLARARRYGHWDSRISDKHPDFSTADPWHFFTKLHPLSRTAFLAVTAQPRLGPVLAHAALGCAEGAARLGWERVALGGATFAYGAEYYRGVREEARSLRGALSNLGRYAKRAPVSDRGRPTWAAARWLYSVASDHRSLRKHRERYHSDVIPAWRVPVDYVQKIGFQMAVQIRTMQLLRDLKLPLLPQVASRLIRHTYNAEIHWETRIGAGLTLVHGNGVVLSRRAVLGEDCLLFHNVTLGESIHPIRREVGAPTLGDGVHVGPGATLLGPITVGEHSKIMAGAVVVDDVPPNSVVVVSDVVVTVGSKQKPSNKGAGKKKTNTKKARKEKATRKSTSRTASAKKRPSKKTTSKARSKRG